MAGDLKSDGGEFELGPTGRLIRRAPQRKVR